MKKGFHFPIDKLTNSVEEVATGRSFQTEVLLATNDDIKTIHKKDGWSFNWKQEFKEEGHSIYKLVLEGDDLIQGLVSIEPMPVQLYIEMHFDRKRTS